MERRPVAVLPYLDIVLVLVAAVAALALGAPGVGVVVGAGAWIVVRAVSTVTDRRIQDVDDLRRRLGLGVFAGMVRVWILAGAIIAVGVTSSRRDALACALLIFGAFSTYFAVSAVAHRRRKRTSA